MIAKNIVDNNNSTVAGVFDVVEQLKITVNMTLYRVEWVSIILKCFEFCKEELDSTLEYAPKWSSNEYIDLYCTALPPVYVFDLFQDRTKTFFEKLDSESYNMLLNVALEYAHDRKTIQIYYVLLCNYSVYIDSAWYSC